MVAIFEETKNERKINVISYTICPPFFCTNTLVASGKKKSEKSVNDAVFMFCLLAFCAKLQFGIGMFSHLLYRKNRNLIGYDTRFFFSAVFHNL